MRSPHREHVARHVPLNNAIAREIFLDDPEPPHIRDGEVQQPVFASLTAHLPQGRIVSAGLEDGGTADQGAACIAQKIAAAHLDDDVTLGVAVMVQTDDHSVLIDRHRPGIDEADPLAALKHQSELLFKLRGMP